MFELFFIVAFIALVIFVIYTHMDTHDKDGKVIEAAPMMTSKTVFLASSEALGIVAGATSATVVKAVSADKDRRAAGEKSLAASAKFQGFGTTSAYDRVYASTTTAIDDFIYNKPASAHGVNVG